ncbi:hypothetical protein QWY78_11965 [Kaistella yonginensis]|nr:hypothetical protein [Kaistella yonginensis]
MGPLVKFKKIENNADHEKHRISFQKSRHRFDLKIMKLLDHQAGEMK